MIFVNDTSSVGSFVNVKNGAREIEELRARDESEINADEYIDTDDSLFTFETCAMTDDEILSKVTSIEEDEENCQDTDEIEDLIQPPTKRCRLWRFCKHAPFMMLMLEMICVPK